MSLNDSLNNDLHNQIHNQNIHNNFMNQNLDNLKKPNNVKSPKDKIIVFSIIMLFAIIGVTVFFATKPSGVIELPGKPELYSNENFINGKFVEKM